MKTKISKIIDTIKSIRNNTTDIILTLFIFIPVYAIPTLLLSIEYKKEDITRFSGTLIMLWIYFTGLYFTDIYIERPFTSRGKDEN